MIFDNSFSVSVGGSGRFLGMFVTDLMKKYPRAKVYDDTDRFRESFRLEISLGISKFALPDFKKMAIESLKNRAFRETTDVTVTFNTTGDIEDVTVTGRKNGFASINIRSIDHMRKLERFIDEILKLVRQAH